MKLYQCDDLTKHVKCWGSRIRFGCFYSIQINSTQINTDDDDEPNDGDGNPKAGKKMKWNDTIQYAINLTDAGGTLWNLL